MSYYDRALELKEEQRTGDIFTAMRRWVLSFRKREPT